MSIFSALTRNYAPDTIVAKDASGDYTTADLLSRCQELQQSLASFGAHSLALLANNSLDWIIADLVCQHTGRTLLPLPTFFSPDQIEFTLRQCAVDALLTDEPDKLQCLEKVDSVFFIKLPGSTLYLAQLKSATQEKAMPIGTGKITFTSGSTGQPKGVCLSHAQLEEQAVVLRDRVGLEHPRHLCVLPLSTLLENVAGVYAPLLAAGEIIVPEQSSLGFAGSTLVDPQKFLQTISAAQPDSMILVPQLLLLLVSAANQGWQPPKSLKFIAVGGSKVAAELLAAATSLGLPVFEGYGLSECGSVVSLNTARENKARSCGKPLPHIALSIDDGEVVIRGNSMLGYFGEPESWGQTSIKTGDLGHLDAEGFLHIDGRRKNLLISSFGRNVSPEWVESELLANPILSEAVVFGDARPFCIALLSLHKNTDSSAVEEWIKQVNNKLPDYARVVCYLILPQPIAAVPGRYTTNGRPRREAIGLAFAEQIENLYRNNAVA